MVSPARLVEAISGVTGIARPTVTDMDRRLVKAGLRTKGGRGLNAARMTATDAARLLTAVLASPQSNMAAEAVTRYAATKVDGATTSTAPFGALEIDDLNELTATHSFVDCLAALLVSAAHGALSIRRNSAPEGTWPRIEIFAFTRATLGRLRISGVPNGMTANLNYRLPERHPAAYTMAARPGDLEQSRRITERTIYAIADLLAEESRHA